jgi:hypothetical protein
MSFVYLGVLHVAIGCSHLPRAGRRLAFAGAGVFLAAQMGLLAAYFVRLPRQWAAWSPARFDDIVHPIPASAKIANTFELWHAWRAAGRPVRIIDPSLPIDELHWSQAPLSLEKYDAVIFSDATSGVMDAALAAGAFQPGTWSREVRPLDEKHYTIFRRAGPSGA